MGWVSQRISVYFTTNAAGCIDWRHVILARSFFGGGAAAEPRIRAQKPRNAPPGTRELLLTTSGEDVNVGVTETFPTPALTTYSEPAIMQHLTRLMQTSKRYLSGT